MAGAAALEDVQRWAPNRGPQERFLASSAFEVLYGGAAGGGKSESLVVAPLRWTSIPSFRGLLLRRTIPDLKRAGSLIERTEALFPSLGATYHETDRVWSFPSGARIELSALEHEKDRFNYRSSQFQFIGFDELTTFAESQYVFLLSRLRGKPGAALRFRAATNPGGPGHDWVLKRWAPWLYPPGHVEHDGPYAKPGEVLWYLRSPSTGEEQIVEKGTSGALSRTFIPALPTDNPHLGTEYLSNLDALDPVTREQLKHGNWMARPSRGAYFKRAWFKIVDAAPARVDSRCRYWDRAATAGDGDWTAGVRLSRVAGEFYVEDLVRGQWGPKDVEGTIKATAQLDPSDTRLVLEQDPAQAGKFEKEYYLRELAGFDVHAVPPQGDKVTRAKPVSAQAEAGNIKIVRGRWNEAFIREIEAFPEGHDDQVDSLSGAFRQCMLFAVGLAKTSGNREMTLAKMGGF